MCNSETDISPGDSFFKEQYNNVSKNCFTMTLSFQESIFLGESFYWTNFIVGLKLDMQGILHQVYLNKIPYI